MDQMTARKQPDFQIFTGILKTSRTAEGKMRLHGVASSTTKDLHGDTMTETAIDDMERAANNNMTIFLNHSYEVPEDVGGSVIKAVKKTRSVDQDGNPNVDLDMDIEINEENERAVQTFKAIEKGTKLGISIGAMLPDGGYKRNKDGSLIIEHVDLLEASLVGIPANPRSWVDYAVKSINARKDATTVPLGEPTLTLDGENYKIEGKLAGVQLHAGVGVVGEAGPETIVASEDGVIVPIQDAACPSCGGGKGSPKGGCDNKYHDNGDSDDQADQDGPRKDVEPDVQDATVTIIEIDTSDGDNSPAPESDDSDTSQEASTSEPDAGDGGLLDEDGGDTDELLGDDVTKVAASSMGDAVNATFEILRETTSELVASRSENATLKAERIELTKQRDTAQRETQTVLRATQELLNKLAETPLMRKTALASAQAEFDAKFAGVYDEDFLKMLKR